MSDDDKQQVHVDKEVSVTNNSKEHNSKQDTVSENIEFNSQNVVSAVVNSKELFTSEEEICVPEINKDSLLKESQINLDHKDNSKEEIQKVLVQNDDECTQEKKENVEELSDIINNKDYAPHKEQEKKITKASNIQLEETSNIDNTLSKQTEETLKKTKQINVEDNIKLEDINNKETIQASEKEQNLVHQDTKDAGDKTSDTAAEEAKETVFSPPEAFLCETKDKLLILLSLLKKDNIDNNLVFTNKKLTHDWLKFKLKHNKFKLQKVSIDIENQDSPYVEANYCFLITKTDSSKKSGNNLRVYHFDVPNDITKRKNIIEKLVTKYNVINTCFLCCEEYCHNVEQVKKSYEEDISPICWKEDLSQVVDHSLDFKPKEKNIVNAAKSAPTSPARKAYNNKSRQTGYSQNRKSTEYNKKPSNKVSINKKSIVKQVVDSITSWFK